MSILQIIEAAVAAAGGWMAEHPIRAVIVVVGVLLGSGDLTAGVKIMPDGSEAAQTDGLTTGYLDVSGIAGDLKVTSTGTLSSIRVAQYDDARGSLVTDAGLTDAAWTSPHVLTVQRLDGCAFIRIFYAPVDAGRPSEVQSIVIEAAD